MRWGAWKSENRKKEKEKGKEEKKKRRGKGKQLSQTQRYLPTLTYFILQKKKVFYVLKVFTVPKVGSYYYCTLELIKVCKWHVHKLQNLKAKKNKGEKKYGKKRKKKKKKTLKN